MLTNGSRVNGVALPRRWTVLCRDDERRAIAVDVIAVAGGYVAVQLPGCKPVWLDRFQGDHLASCLLKAVTAALSKGAAVMGEALPDRAEDGDDVDSS